MAFTEGNTLTTISVDATMATIVAAPAASTRRLVTTVTAYNGNASSVTFFLEINDGTVYTVIREVVPTLGSFVFTDLLVLESTDKLRMSASDATSPSILVTAHWADSS